MILPIRIILYLLSFVVIWKSAGLIVEAADNFSRLLKISRFAFSFFILGILTSMPEIAVGANSIIEKNPQIFVGNLVGGVIVIFLLIIPLYAIFGNGIKLNHQLNNKNLLLILLVSIAPSFLISDKQATIFEGIFLILLYFFAFYTIEKKQHFVEAVESKFLKKETDFVKNFLRIIIGVGIIFLASRFLVDQTIFFANLFKISPFVISLVVLSLGTNLPEFSIGIRSILLGKKDIAFGDYMGSAAANSLIFGSLVLINKTTVVISDNFLPRFIFLPAQKILYLVGRG